MASRLTSFFAELRRRKVWQVAGVYATTALATALAVAELYDDVGLPEGTPRVVIVLLLIGFPAAVVLAWAYEVKPEEPTDSTVSDGAGPTAPTGGVEDKNSIVVLPFANLSPDSESEYFADGMTEEIINAVANVAGLRVIARTSAFAYKGSNRDVREIGKELGVGTILEGSVRRSGDRLRITAQLIDVSGGHHLWSERYDRNLADVFAIQDEIAQIIARRLGPEGLVPRHRERPTDDLDAYEAFLRGRFHFAKGTPEDYAKSIEHYDRAIALDPEFAEAHAGLAETWGIWAILENPADRFPRARAAALRALEIDPTLADAHATLGFVYFFSDWNWTAAIEEFERAVALNPNSVSALQIASGALGNLGMEEAVTYARRSVSLDPLSAMSNRQLGGALYYVGELAESLEYSRRAVELAPNFLLAHLSVGLVQHDAGLLEEAVATFEHILEVWPNEPYARAELTRVYVRMGRREDALDQLRHLERRLDAAEGQVAVCAAWAHASLGNVDEAFDRLHRAIDARDSIVVSLPTFNAWDPLRSDPRFEAILRQLKFPEWSVRRHA